MKLGRVVSVTEASAGTPTFGYDAGGKGAGGGAQIVYPVSRA
jgi:hypothetical protein